MSNVLTKYDQYSSEDFLCHRTRPVGMLRCGYCDAYYEPEYDEYVEGNTCKNCGEVSFPYEEA